MMTKYNSKQLDKGRKRRASLLNMLNRGKSNQEIADKLGISKQRVSYLIKRARQEQESCGPI